MIKIADYKGNVVARWKMPKTKKQFIWTIIKLVRFYYRCKEANLLTNDLISVLKKFLSLPVVQEKLPTVVVAYSEVATAVKEIKSLKHHEFEEKIVMEKIRKHESAICSLCQINLKYPAYIVYRKGLDVVKMSNCVGIFCLNKTVGKLNNLISSISIEEASKNTNAVQLSLF